MQYYLNKSFNIYCGLFMYMKFKDFLNGFNCIKWLHICDLLKQVCLHRIYIILKKIVTTQGMFYCIGIISFFSFYCRKTPISILINYTVKLVYKEHSRKLKNTCTTLYQQLKLYVLCITGENYTVIYRQWFV